MSCLFTFRAPFPEFDVKLTWLKVIVALSLQLKSLNCHSCVRWGAASILLLYSLIQTISVAFPVCWLQDMRGWGCLTSSFLLVTEMSSCLSHPVIRSRHFWYSRLQGFFRPHSLLFFCFFLVKVIERNHRLAGSDIYFLKYILCIRILELLPSDYSKQLRKGQKDALMFTRHTRSVLQGGRERRRSVRCKGGTSDLCSSMHSLTEWLRLLYYEPVMAPKKRVDISCSSSGMTTDIVKNDMSTLLHTCLGCVIWW